MARGSRGSGAPDPRPKRARQPPGTQQGHHALHASHGASMRRARRNRHILVDTLPLHCSLIFVEDTRAEARQPEGRATPTWNWCGTQ